MKMIQYNEISTKESLQFIDIFSGRPNSIYTVNYKCMSVNLQYTLIRRFFTANPVDESECIIFCFTIKFKTFQH